MVKHNRIDNLLKQLEAEGLNQMVIRTPMMLGYFLGIEPRRIRPDRAVMLYASVDKGVRLLTNRLAMIPMDLDIEYAFHKDGDNVGAEIARHTDHGQVLAMDGEFPAKWLLPLQSRQAAAGYVLADNVLHRLRAIKDPEELELMRQSSAMNDRVMAQIRDFFHDGVTELEVSRRLGALFSKEGASAQGGGLVAFGDHTAKVHHFPTQRQLKPGDPILIDMGAPKQGYCSDMTRTFFWKEVTDKQRMIYDLVLTANVETEKIIKPGVRCCDIDGKGRSIIEAAGYGDKFTHRLGHFIGLEAHDPGDIADFNPQPVEEGMVFSCEPGVYLPGEFGVRIEDLVAVTADGCEILNKDNKSLEILGV